MSAGEGIAEALLLEAIGMALSARALHEPGQPEPTRRLLLIGAQARQTVERANALAGPEQVALLHLDRAAGGVGLGLGNAESMLSDGLGNDAGDGAGCRTAGGFAVVGLNVEAARSYRLLREIVAQAAPLVQPGGCLLVAGPRKGGAEVAATALRALFETVDVEAYRKGHRVYRASGLLAAPAADPAAGPSGLEQPAQTLSLELRGKTLRLVQDERIFARGQLDPASKMLADVFEAPPGAAILDLGCGGGVLGILAALLDPTAHCTLVDADPLAVAAARRGAALSGAENVSVHLSDVLSELPGQTFDVVLMNPPFHRGRAQDLGLAERFLTQASAALRPGGRLWVVCNRFLPYERTLTKALGAPREAAGDRAYKVLVAERRPETR